MRSAARTFIVLFGLAGSWSMSAQSAMQFIIWGDNAMLTNDHYGASRFYAEALQGGAGPMELQWKYAEACRLSNQYPQAAEAYDKVWRKDLGRTHPEALRWLGEMQLCSGQYDEAKKTWLKVKQKIKDKSGVVMQRANNALEGIAMAKENKIAGDILIDHLPEPVNSYDSEFAPRVGPDSLLYLTSLRGELNDNEEVVDTANYHARVYSSSHHQEKWAPVSVLPDVVNTAHQNANSAWSLDGRWFYFARDDGHGAFAIHALDRTAPGSAAVLVLGAPAQSFTQPMVATFDGRQTLFFSWQDLGTNGSMDLRRADINGSTVGEIAPIASKLDTPGNESTPWYDNDTRTLWFSSDFLPGFGGFDIFHATFNGDSLGPAVNEGLPVNGPTNDLYFTYDVPSVSGYFTSNRIGSLAKKGATCCNDIYRFSHPGREIPKPPPPKDTLTVAERRLTSLREKLPIRLYFHNDEPNPRSWDTLTTLTYEQTYRSYKALVPDYHAAWGDNTEGLVAIDGFFWDKVDFGFSQLNDFIALLRQALDEGQRIELQVRGFASPLAKSDYNANLSLRRISSMVNYLREVDGGALRPYLSSGALLIRKSPFGEDESATGVSDELEDLKGSVYSVGASMERRIEIEQVLLGEDTTAHMEPPGEPGSDPITNVYNVLTNTITQDIGTIAQLEHRNAVFLVRNTMDRPMTLIGARPDCDCVSLELPGTPIPANGTQRVVIEFNGRATPGVLNRGITVTTDGEPVSLRLIVTGTVTPMK